MMSQRDKVLQYMLTHDGITDNECRECGGGNRCAARIHELIGRGHDITSEREAHRNGFHARYRLREFQVDMFGTNV